ncbi:DHX8 [Branchiostoma lanceolatum]|uniref:DHX8 protein n=1 Tax=Branchiostoma lanceolatum TaxID=7740 RepID=A0A8J9YQ45_BRALA|nr:DHX8 [Branchiostoma lanceolatum]
MDTHQFHTVFENHPGFDQASIEFEDGSKGYVYFATHKDAENFSRSVRTVGEPERVDRESVAKKRHFLEKRQFTFEDKLVAFARQVDSGVRQVCASHNEKVEEIAAKINDVRPSGRFVSIDEHTVRQQQRKVLQMKQVELTKQKEEFDQTIKIISEELVSLSPDAATRAKLLGHRLGGDEISMDTVEVKSDSDNALCTRARDAILVQERTEPGGCENEPTGPAGDHGMSKSEESVVSLVDGAQDLAEDSQTDEMKTSMASGEGEIRSDVQAEEEILQSTPKSPEEQAKMLNDLKSRYLRECSRLQAALPMYAYRTKLLQEVEHNRVIVVVAETGSGKSTQIVQYLADNTSEPGKLIACTQPRKIAAISLADRVAVEYGCKVGDEIGYAVGSKRRVSDRTKAVFMTDQVLLNSCVKEGELDKYSCIIIDEAHERSIHTDLLLGILKKSLQTRPGLRLIIASATIDPTLFSNYFGGCPVMSVPGRTFPVDIIYKTPQFGDSNVDYVSETVNKVVEIHNNEGEGDILAFLTSPLEIERACERTTHVFGSRVNSVLVLPLHGKLQPEDQRKVFEPAPAGARKVVFATNIAETSVTIPGIIYVVDSGMIKERYFDAKRNLSVLDVKMVAQSSAIQRAGRAGRIQPGRCYRLYTEEEFKEMRVSTPPEILRMHLGMAVLKLMELGVTDVTDFDFVERPSDDALQDAIHQLDILGAIEKTEGEISPKPTGPVRSEAAVTDQPDKTTESLDNLNKSSAKSGFGALVDFWVSKMFWRKDKQTEEPRIEEKTQEEEKPQETKRTSIRLTELGKKMSQLPTEPRLSKMILEGVSQGCGKEALLVAALASAAGSVYFRAGTEEEKATADRQKMKFCHEGGDLLSMLDVYRDWVAQSTFQRNKWCVANSINAKTMRLAEESFKEMKHQLASSGVHISEDFAPVETVNIQLPRLILGAYCNNLCVFSGHERAGYIVGRLRQCVHIHPSSALKHLGEQHKWVVFDEILRTSRDFIINVTPVDVEWLGDVASRYASTFDLRSLERSTMTSCQIKGYGPEVVRGLIGRRAQTLKSLEAIVSDDEKHLCVIEVDTDRCQVAVFTTHDRLEGGEKIVRDAMNSKHSDLRNESDEIPVVNYRGDGTRMVLGKGGEVQDILMPSEFRCVDVLYKYAGKDPEGCQGIMDIFTYLDGILIRTAFDRLLTTANGQRVGTLTFSSCRAAQETVNRYDNHSFRDGTLILKPVNQSRGPGGGGPQQVELNVVWFRRECKGFGYLDCDGVMDPDPDGVEARRIVADIDGKAIEGGIGIIRASINKKRNSSVHVRGPPYSLNEQTLERTVRRNSVVVPRRYSVVWKPQTSPVDTGHDEARLKELFSSYVMQGTMRVSVNKPKPESQVRGYAMVTMSDANEAQNAVTGLHGKRDLMGTQALSVERKLQCNVVCNAKIYDVLEDSFRDALEDLTREGTRLVKIEPRRAKSGKTVYFKLSGNDVGEVARAKSRLHEVMRPETVAHEDPTVTCRLFDKLGLDFIQTVRNQVKCVHIDADRRTFTISLYGKDEPRLEAKRRISDYLESLTQHRPREIHLAGSSRPAGVMKALLNKYGLNLDGLKDITGAREIRLDIRKHLLVVQESDETFDKVKEEVESSAKEILERKGESCQREDEDDSEDCGVCLCPIDGKDYRLQCCGHRYCHECIKLQLTTAIRSQDYPIRCGTDGCSREFFLRDLRLLLNQADFRQLVTGSLNTFVNKSGGRYRPCPTPDCPSVYRCVSEEEGEGQVFQCCKCNKRLCTRCHVDMHDGMSCGTWQIFKGDPDDTLREWMKDKTDVKFCPKCSWVIEKTAGCQHMECRCGAHICWICLKVFSTSGACYGHLSSAHGGYM